MNALLAALVLCAAETPLDTFDYPDVAAAQAWKPSDGTPPVDVKRDGGRNVLVLTAPFVAQPKLTRAVIDRNATLDLCAPGEFRLAVTVDNPRACTNWTLYFRSGKGWYGCAATLPVRDEEDDNGAAKPSSPLPPDKPSLTEQSPQAAGTTEWSGPGVGAARSANRPTTHTFIFQKASFTTEGTPAGWDKIDGVRIAAWKAAAIDATIELHSLAAVTHPIALVVPDGKSWQATGEKRTAHDQAGLIADMLKELGLGCDLLNESSLAETLAGHSIAILAYNPGLSRAAEDALIQFVERGGKVFVCYQLPERLGKALGFGNAKYVRPEERRGFAEMRFDTANFPEIPQAVKQASWNITDAQPVGQNARVLGRWFSPDGKPTGHNAVLLSDRGVFCSHIVLSDDRDAKAQMLAALFGKFCPDSWRDMARAACDSMYPAFRTDSKLPYQSRIHIEQLRAAAHDLFNKKQYFEACQQARKTRIRVVHEYLAHVPSPSPEGRAMWNHSGTGAFPGDWEKSAKLLADNGFNMVLPNMLWGGLAHYESDLLPRSETFRKHGDQIAQCCAAAAKHGLEVHVWKVNYNCSNAPKSLVDKMRLAGRTQMTVKGEPQDWLCPSHPENQKLECDTMLEVARKYPVAGLHFDYIRYPTRECCYCDGCRERFERDSQQKVAAWPGDCYSGSRKDEYHAWRCRQITAVVAAVSREARKLKPDIKISAAVFGSYPDCRTSVGQDWPEWATAGYVDFLCPMDYTPKDDEFKRLVRKQLKLVDGRVPLYPGIGATASRMALSPDRVVGQIQWARELGAAGFTVFDFGPSTAETFVPAIGLGAGKEKAVPVHRK